jgi:tRNA pseudouridine(38-40) synthase
MRVKCTIAYDGHLFNGYQVQPGKRTVQSELEKALAVIHKTDGRVPVFSAVLTAISSGSRALSANGHFSAGMDSGVSK